MVVVAGALATCVSTAGAQSEPVAIKPPYVRPVLDSLADSSQVARDSAPPPNCWRPQRRPPCSGFFLTEFGIGGAAPLVPRRRWPP